MDGSPPTLTGVLWDRVDRIFAFKRDLYITDQICVAVLAGDDGLVVNEEMEGFLALTDELHRRFPGCPPYEAWWERVALPAFETNEYLLWPQARPTADDSAVAPPDLDSAPPV
ncbi:hypothetical protein [Engelhardtia mirabilis]|uniref:hypothetical protein n=1 Tax=Engelhardtia mirabilis TaxID=2528011 RepID=UPI003AF3944C